MPDLVVLQIRESSWFSFSSILLITPPNQKTPNRLHFERQSTAQTPKKSEYCILFLEIWKSYVKWWISSYPEVLQ
ncbi:hypothetical protein, partial [Salmonella sp. s54395]|uniref:hypothetical protein n=1 Tax=Salmonella sp. s54395 TaxID=3159664 RepID=UPI00397F28BC